MKSEFYVKQIDVDGREFIVEEFIYLFGICIRDRVHCESGVPYDSYFAAKKAKERLEKRLINKEIKYIWIVVLILLSVLFYFAAKL